MPKRRVNISDEAYQRICLIAKNQDKSSLNCKEIVDNYIENITETIEKQDAEIQYLKEHCFTFSDELSNRVSKLQALLVLDREPDVMMKKLLDSFIEHNREIIEESVKSL